MPNLPCLIVVSAALFVFGCGSSDSSQSSERQTASLADLDGNPSMTNVDAPMPMAQPEPMNAFPDTPTAGMAGVAVPSNEPPTEMEEEFPVGGGVTNTMEPEPRPNVPMGGDTVGADEDLSISGALSEDEQDPELEDSMPDAQNITVSNALIPCQQGSVVGPSVPQEANHYAAAVLTPPSLPFTVTTVGYDLVAKADDRCVNTLGHRVDVFVVNAQSPLTASPSTDAVDYLTMNVPESRGVESKRTVRLVLERPIRINEGEQLVVAVQLGQFGANKLCIGMCTDTAGSPGRNLWSNAANEPFEWQDLLVDFRLTGHLVVHLEGQTNLGD